MDKIGFNDYLKRQKKSQSTIDQYKRLAKVFHDFIFEKEKKTIDNAVPEDLYGYYIKLKAELKELKKHLAEEEEEKEE